MHPKKAIEVHQSTRSSHCSLDVNAEAAALSKLVDASAYTTLLTEKEGLTVAMICRKQKNYQIGESGGRTSTYSPSPSPITAPVP